MCKYLGTFKGWVELWGYPRPVVPNPEILLSIPGSAIGSLSPSAPRFHHCICAFQVELPLTQRRLPSPGASKEYGISPSNQSTHPYHSTYHSCADRTGKSPQFLDALVWMSAISRARLCFSNGIDLPQSRSGPGTIHRLMLGSPHRRCDSAITVSHLLSSRPRSVDVPYGCCDQVSSKRQCSFSWFLLLVFQ